MKDQLAKLLESRDRESYLAIRDALLAWPDFNPDSSELNGACELLESGSLGAAQERIASSMPNLVLSPRAHLILASIAEKSQDESRARFERFFAAACTEGILATGDGSKERPYIVCRISDEYDVLQYLGKVFQCQSLVPDGDRYFDSMDCEDGTEIWFDITAACSRRKKRFEPGEST